MKLVTFEFGYFCPKFREVPVIGGSRILRVQIFLFYIQFFRNEAASGVSDPYEVGALLREILNVDAKCIAASKPSGLFVYFLIYFI